MECGLEQEYWNRVEEGFQVTPSWHQGFLRDNGRYASSIKFGTCVLKLVIDDMSIIV